MYKCVSLGWRSVSDEVGGVNMKYLSVKETAEKWGISKRRVQVLCTQNRIDGLIRVGTAWGIPVDAPKPDDARIKSGRYIKSTKPTQVECNY